MTPTFQLTVAREALSVALGRAALAASTKSTLPMGQNAIGGEMREPMPTVLAGATRYADVRAFLVAYYGNEKDGGDLFDPMRTVTSKDRYGLVTVEGVQYEIADIGMRMLEPRELYRAQGFPDSYKIDIPFTNPKTGKTKPMTKTAQVRMVGNSVCPPLARAIVDANCPELARREVAA